MTIHQITERAIEEIRKMTLDEKAHLRAKLLKAFLAGPQPKIAYKM